MGGFGKIYQKLDDMRLSIVIPCYEMGGRGIYFLKRLLKTIILQDADRNDFEVIVSDHSLNEDIKNLCLDLSHSIEIDYVRNEQNRGSSSANLNNGIYHSRGEYIKPIFQDDCFHTTEDLSIILKNLKHDWIAHPYIHYNEDSERYFNSRIPSYNPEILKGVNTIGPPTCIAFKKDHNLFDENLIWFMDCEFYHRLYIKYGEPYIIQSGPISVNTVWGGQVTNTMINDNIISSETEYLNKKYDSN
jgi:hypothetical protein